MAAFVAKQMVGNKLSAVKGKCVWKKANSNVSRFCVLANENENSLVCFSGLKVFQET
jgi:hypothetical protein